MSGSRKEALETESDETTEETGEKREVFLRDGRRVTVTETGRDQLVEVRAESGTIELRILLTEQGPVLQMESVRLQLKAEEAVEITSKKVEIKGTETLDLTGGEVNVEGEQDVNVDAKGEVHVKGTKIWLN
jgi:hypothetical protein